MSKIFRLKIVDKQSEKKFAILIKAVKLNKENTNCQ